MKIFKHYSNLAIFSMLFLLTIFAAGCGGSNDAGVVVAETTYTPAVIPTSPVNGATDVALNTSISAIPDRLLDSSTVDTTTFTLKKGTTAVTGVVTYENNSSMLFNPSANLTASTQYTATITTGVLDSNSTALLLTDMVWSFTTGAAPDSIAPTVISTNPDTNDTNVPTDRSVSALFNEALDPATVSAATFTLAAAGPTYVTGTVSYSSNTMVFNPDENLSTTTEYTATITTGVKDLSGNALAVDKVWTFTTGAIAAVTQTAVNLGTAGNYVILAKTAISTTGTTAITGDIGISPAARTYITGFSDTLFSDGTYSTSPLVTGKIYAANMADPTPINLTTSVGDMLNAYNDAAGRAVPDYNELYAGNVSGKILNPGLYKWGTSVLITDVGVTITGSATDIWIFQISGDLTVSNGAIVTLAGGALAKNIFWQVAGGAGVSLGTTSDFKGIVLAQKGIVVNTGARVNGRLLAQTAVTLDANAVTQPAN